MMQGNAVIGEPMPITELEIVRVIIDRMARRVLEELIAPLLLLSAFRPIARVA